MKKVITSLILLFVCVTSKSQSITPFVVNSTGGSYSTATNMLEFNVGEVATSTLNNGNFITQGLLQASVKQGGIGFISIKETNLSIFPNPTNSAFQIEGLANGESYLVTITDLTGKIVLQQRYSDKQWIDISSLSTAIYHVSLLNQNTQTNFKITKTN